MFFEVSRQVARRVAIGQELPTAHTPVLDEAAAAVDHLPDPWLLSTQERCGSLIAAQQLINQLQAWMHDTVAVADECKDSQRLYAGTTGTMTAIATNANLPAGSATVRRAAALARMPATSEAFRAGRITTAHVQALTSSAGQIDGFAEVEAALVTTAELVDPAELRRLLKVLIEQSRPEALDEDLDDQRARRGISLSKLSDGMWRVDGYLDSVGGQLLADTLNSFSDRACPGDTRSRRQIRADALTDICAAACANTKPLWVSGLTVTVDIATLPEHLQARFDDETPLGPDTLALLACTPQLSVLFGHTRGETFVPLHLARTARRATHHQWSALKVRDGGCLRCGRASTYCHAHHIVPWAQGGATDVENLALLCARCHTDLHMGRYQITVRNGKPQIMRQ